MKRWALLPVLLAASWSSAQMAGGLGSSGPDWVLKAPFTAAELRGAMSTTGGAVLRYAPRLGRIVSWTGAISLGADFFNMALKSAYDEIKSEANGGPVSSGSKTLDSYMNGVQHFDLTYLDHDEGELHYAVKNVLFRCDYVNTDTGEIGTMYSFIYHITNRWGVVDDDFYYSKENKFGHARVNESTVTENCNNFPANPANLNTVFNDPVAYQTMGALINKYAKDHPDRLAAALTYSGPVPNANQRADAVVAPGLDSNGDGIRDETAVAQGLDAGDPAQHPDLSTTSTSVTNPDGSVTVTTTTYDPDGTPHVTTRTATPGKVVTDTDNPDGSKTHTETTTNPDLTRTEVSTNTSVQTVTNADGSQTVTTTTTITTTTYDKEGKLVSTETKTTAETKNIPKENVCSESQVAQPDGTCKDKDIDPGNECNDFSVPRFLKHPGTYIKELFIPCDQWTNVFDELKDAVKDRFPFSMTSRLDHLVTFNGTANQADVLPSKIGPFDLDWSWIAPLLLVTSVLFKSAIGYIAINFVIGKFSGQLVMK